MKKILIFLFLSFNLFAEPLPYLGLTDVEILENEKTIIVIDKFKIESANDAMFRVNSFLNSLNDYSIIELQTPLSQSVLKIKYMNDKLNLNIDVDWVNRYFSNISLSDKSKMLSELISPNTEKYRSYSY